MRRVPYLLVAGLVPLAAWLVARPFIDASPPTFPVLSVSLGFALVAFAATVALIPGLAPAFARAGLKGRDLLKPDSTLEIPESIGLISASVYILLLIVFIPFLFADALRPSKIAEEKTPLTEVASRPFPHQQLSAYLSALLSLYTATLLGFLDDVFDIRWRHKLPIPIVASVPMLIVYFADGGITSVVVPTPLRPYLGQIVDLGALYYVYMAMVSTFCTNSINILAGINGLEVSQALIIALSIAANDLLYLPWRFTGAEWSAGMAYGSVALVERHLLSLYFMLPLIGVCAGLLYHNRHPASVFPGDTLCYFTGMAFAVVGILGHFSKTLLLFFIPQAFNFILSAPQLFGLVPCPRHRVPRVDRKTLLLSPSVAQFERPPSTLATLVLRIFAALRLTRLTTHPHTGVIMEATNLTVLNMLLLWTGPIREATLVWACVALQFAGSVVAFTVRYGLAGLVYDGDRR
ncbi:UDP-N-acetylglucosamine-dolichyl [Exidia glandulosa HHB12029]|uniref:UDP-N-acetylglucosamine--dolichyl-phosphate N-acetylglucosaminephosphotransferase n=1 Tax=Exidia glandulosa HHB12029 TaxID=1314781 RepID=A0A165NM09_EXIGL|nr:UDP-N-acetylglucosamine-dolichyl [Exidia glandulosa HHB12029]